MPKPKWCYGIWPVPLLVWHYGLNWGSIDHENETSENMTEMVSFCPCDLFGFFNFFPPKRHGSTQIHSSCPISPMLFVMFTLCSSWHYTACHHVFLDMCVLTWMESYHRQSVGCDETVSCTPDKKMGPPLQFKMVCLLVFHNLILWKTATEKDTEDG